MSKVTLASTDALHPVTRADVIYFIHILKTQRDKSSLLEWQQGEGAYDAMNQ